MKRVANRIFLLIFLAVLAAVPLGTLRSPSRISFWENRTLAPRPQLTAESVWDGSFFSQIEPFFSDHIVGRDSFMAVSTWADLKLGRPVVNDQIASGDVLLSFYNYTRWDLSGQSKMAETMGERYGALNELVKNYGGYFCYVGVPTQSAYFKDHYPSYMDNRQWHLEDTRRVFAEALARRDIPHVDMVSVFDALGCPRELYSAVDHHYTYAGALVTYQAILERINRDTGLDLEILHSGDGLDLTELPNPFIGSYGRKLYDLWPSDEKLVIGTPTSEIPFTRLDNGVLTAPSLYALPAEEDTPVLYGLYMGGDVAETIIRTGRTELPDALIFGESYTNAVETVLWTAFHETRSLDLRYYSEKTLEEYIAEYQPDVVICLRDDSSCLLPVD